MNIAIVAGFWGQNVGNAFINLGGEAILRRAFPGSNVGFVRDQPGYRTFHNQRGGNPRRALDVISRLDTDLVVLQGALFTRTFPDLWNPTFAALAKRGVKVLLLGAGLSVYNDDEVRTVRRFLRERPPAAIVTRDECAFEAVQGCAGSVHNGIDSAFALPHAYHPLRMDADWPYLVLTFDHYPEPRVYAGREASAGGPKASNTTTRREFSFNGDTWQLTMPRLQTALARMGKLPAYLGALMDFRRLEDSISGLNVVRCEHRFQPHVGWKIYRRSGAVVTDEPFTLCSLYASTRLTLTDRVHAAVATMAYGNPAMIFGHTGRTALFDRVGAKQAREQPVSVSSELLDREIQSEIDFLRIAIAQ